ncbi:hypothetical protein EDF24_2079 [Curtobacterium sp. PhB130]|uniref:hypothetical protein n=1 Tax=unclassified Curtobacterium TaxID=257496 RepID=UPI000F4BD173|nr:MULTISPECIES: hypothetical protein [unclassified Curtobacterium]ROP58509.1 hypothetical protein EDF55_3716 [Curtobacterium sp. ZW137]ROS74650.1 hypothetical protein EDF24_2079 [Curtobacterium sp. PhB130]
MTDTTQVSDPTDIPFADTAARPWTDVDEWRDEPVRHRYVHGGFTGTDTRFSFYFPPAEQYQGRFFQHVTPRPLSEDLAQQASGQADKIGFAAASGAYFVETNGGGEAAGDPMSGVDPRIGAYEANAAAARYSRVVAEEVYGPHRPFGYAYGGSGGAYRTIGAAENTTGVWDGYVPYVVGSPMAIPNVFTVRMHAQRILHDAFPAIVDAYDAGSDRAPAELLADVLTEAQAAALAEVTRMGFPPRAWFAWGTLGTHAFSALYPGIVMADPAYFDHDFWNVDGYLGADPDDPIHAERTLVETSVAALLSTADAVAAGLVPDRSAFTGVGGVEPVYDEVRATDVAAFTLGHTLDHDVAGAELQVLTGAAAGARIRLSGTTGDAAVIDLDNDPETVGRIAVGDRVRVDNANFLAAQTYHRHQVPDASYAVWDQFRDADGRPGSPQRPFLLGPLFAASASGTVQTGRISDKTIVVACLLDREAFAWQADWYRSRVVEHLGDAADDTFRLWYVDNALHGDDEHQEFPTRTVSYLGVLQQALRALARWVEDGVAPAASTRYDVVDGQVVVPPTASERAGVQPVVDLSSDGSRRFAARVGEAVAITASATVPTAGGEVVALEWHDGQHEGYVAEPVTPARRVTATRHVVFDEPGTYFVTARVTAQPTTASGTAHELVQDLDRVRVVVS